MADIWPGIAPVYDAAKSGDSVKATVTFWKSGANFTAAGPLDRFEDPTSIGLRGTSLGKNPFAITGDYERMDVLIQKTGKNDTTVLISAASGSMLLDSPSAATTGTFSEPVVTIHQKLASPSYDDNVSIILAYRFPLMGLLLDWRYALRSVIDRISRFTHSGEPPPHN